MNLLTANHRGETIPLGILYAPAKNRNSTRCFAAFTPLPHAPARYLHRAHALRALPTSATATAWRIRRGVISSGVASTASSSIVLVMKAAWRQAA